MSQGKKLELWNIQILESVEIDMLTCMNPDGRSIQKMNTITIQINKKR